MRCPRVILETDHEIIVSVGDGDPSLIPPVVEDPVGASLLDLVHPVDRPGLAEWLREGIGVSDPFRRAAADDPPRWFRFVSARGGVGGQSGNVLFQEVTDEVREDLLRERFNAVLAREVGAELVARSAGVAAELAGADLAVVAELRPPVAVIRSSHGRGVPAPGTMMPLEGGPLGEAVLARSIRHYADGVVEVFPEWGVLRAVGARGLALVPAISPGTGVSVGVIVAVFLRPKELLPVESELLELLAVRMAVELTRREGDRREPWPAQGVPVPDTMLPLLALAIAGRGLTHTLNNLLGGLALNAQLAGEAAGPEEARPHLERLVEGAGRGARITRKVAYLTGGRGVDRERFDLARVVREGAEFVGAINESARIETIGPGSPLEVWGDPGLLFTLVVSLLAPLADAVPSGLEVRVEVRRGAEGEAVIEFRSGWQGVLGVLEGEEGRLGLHLVRRVVAMHGGELVREHVGGEGVVRVILPVVFAP